MDGLKMLAMIRHVLQLLKLQIIVPMRHVMHIFQGALWQMKEMVGVFY